jgi:RNA polymerase sigma-70 factor (ECF subfamily)
VSAVAEQGMSDRDVVELYERTVDVVYRYASRLCGHDRAAAEELVQETYLCVVQMVRRGSPDVVDGGWLIVTCRSRFLDRLRSQRRREAREHAAVRQLPVAVATPEGGSASDRLAGLPADQRAALVLRYVDDLAVPEVARLLGRSVHATESLLARGRAGLRARMGTEEQ